MFNSVNLVLINAKCPGVLVPHLSLSQLMESTGNNRSISSYRTILLSNSDLLVQQEWEFSVPWHFLIMHLEKRMRRKRRGRIGRGIGGEGGGEGGGRGRRGDWLPDATHQWLRTPYLALYTIWGDGLFHLQRLSSGCTLSGTDATPTLLGLIHHSIWLLDKNASLPYYNRFLSLKKNTRYLAEWVGRWNSCVYIWAQSR